MTAIRVAEEFHLDYTIEHCTEGYMITDALKARNVRCTWSVSLASIQTGNLEHETGKPWHPVRSWFDHFPDC